MKSVGISALSKLPSRLSEFKLKVFKEYLFVMKGDTLKANLKLGFKGDERDYKIVEFILNHYQITQIRLLTNNANKLKSLKGVDIVERVPVIITPNAYNKAYLEVKRDKMRILHLINR